MPTVKELKEQIKALKKDNCPPLSGKKKAELEDILKKLQGNSMNFRVVTPASSRIVNPSPPPSSSPSTTPKLLSDSMIKRLFGESPIVPKRRLKKQ